MSARIINGKAFAERLSGRIVSAISTFQSETGRVPGLAVVLVSNDPASEVYVRSKDRKALELGMESFQHILPQNTTQEQLLELVAELNANDAVDGILVQLPLPKQIDELTIVSAVDPGKDVDGLHVVNAGRLVAGLPGMTSCTPLTAVDLYFAELMQIDTVSSPERPVPLAGEQAERRDTDRGPADARRRCKIRAPNFWKA